MLVSFLFTESAHVNEKEQNILDLTSLLRKQFRHTNRICWVENKNSGVYIAPDHKEIKRESSTHSWDTVVRSVLPLTRGLNVLEFSAIMYVHVVLFNHTTVQIQPQMQPKHL
jgi:hypothetical protein